MTSADPRARQGLEPCAMRLVVPRRAGHLRAHATPRLTELGEGPRGPGCTPKSAALHAPGFRGSLLKLNLASWESQNLKLFYFYAFPKHIIGKVRAGVY